MVHKGLPESCSYTETEEPFDYHRGLQRSLVTWRQWGRIDDKAKGSQRSCFLQIPSLTQSPFCLQLHPTNLQDLLFLKPSFIFHAKKPFKCDSFHFSFRVPHIPQPHLSNFRHYSHYFMTFLVAQHPLHLLLVLSRHHDSPPPIIHRHTHTSVPQFFCQDPNSFLMPTALCTNHSSLPLPFHLLQGICLPLIFLLRGSVYPTCPMLRTSFCAKDFVLCFSFWFRLPPSPSLLTSGLSSHPFPCHCYVFFLSRRGIMQRGCVQLY